MRLLPRDFLSKVEESVQGFLNRDTGPPVSIVGTPDNALGARSKNAEFSGFCLDRFLQILFGFHLGWMVRVPQCSNHVIICCTNVGRIVYITVPEPYYIIFSGFLIFLNPILSTLMEQSHCFFKLVLMCRQTLEAFGT